MLFELINPSDPYTYTAASFEVAAVAACLLSTGFGCRCIDPGASDETSPILLGWEQWLGDRGIDEDWLTAHMADIADAWESFVIGSADSRADVELALSHIPTPEGRQSFLAARQDRDRSSVNQIGEVAYENARRYRRSLQKLPVVATTDTE
jgi:hypothetical protein